MDFSDRVRNTQQTLQHLGGIDETIRWIEEDYAQLEGPIEDLHVAISDLPNIKEELQEILEDEIVSENAEKVYERFRYRIGAMLGALEGLQDVIEDGGIKHTLHNNHYEKTDKAVETVEYPQPELASLQDMKVGEELRLN